MKTNKETLQTAMDRRLSFLDDLPSCRAAVQYRIAQEEEPAVKKKLSFGLVVAMGLILLSVAALAAGLLLSPRVSAARLADQALMDSYGISVEMQTFFQREEKEFPDGSVQVTYTGIGGMEYVLGTYTAVVRDGKAVISWNRDGENTSGGYEAEAWGQEQLAQMMKESEDERLKIAFMDKAREIAERHQTPETNPAESSVDEDYFEKLEAEKTAAMNARKLSEEEMIGIGRKFILDSYQLNEEQIARMELFTHADEEHPNNFYWMINGQPCFQVEYLLYDLYTVEQMQRGEPRTRTEKDGYYIVYVNVETGVVEQYEYNSALAGMG